MKDDFSRFVEWFVRAVTYRRTHQPCSFGDPICPCQDGDPCHYVDETYCDGCKRFSVGPVCPYC